MQVNRVFLLDLFIRWFFYELIFFVGFGVASIIFKTFHFKYALTHEFASSFLLISFGFLLVSLFAMRLRGQVTITLDLFVCLFAVFLFAGLVNFQAILVMGVILATTFLYECHPFYLRRWVGFLDIKYALDATAVFILGLFLLLKQVGSYFFTLFFVFYFVLKFIRRVQTCFHGKLRE